MKMSDKQTHDHGIQTGDRCRRDRMCIKDFQKFNIRCDHGDQVSFILSFQFRRSQSAQCLKYLVTDQRQQFKGNKVIAGLLCIAQDAPQHCKNCHTRKQKLKRYFPQTKHLQNSKRSKDRDKGSAKMSQKPHQDCQDHIAGQWFYQMDQFFHNCKIASFFHMFFPSFP